MRRSLLAWSFLSISALPVFASPSEDASANARLFKREEAPAPEGESFSTVFNGVEVPFMKELTPDNFETITKDGYWSVHLSLSP